ncbi:MAG: translation initiation factor IF-6 [Candidatus Micrarchaeia archaeon]
MNSEIEVVKHRLFGNDFVGGFAVATDSFAITTSRISDRDAESIRAALKVEIKKVQFLDSELIGLFSKANSNGVLLSNTIEEEDAKKASKELGINMEVLKSSINALGTNMLANDKIAIINPDYKQNEVKQIEDVLGVEAIKMKIGGFKTVGAMNILTNRGMLLNNKATDEEEDRINSMLGFKVSRGTADTGLLSVGLLAIANSNGILIGEGTTNYELAHIIEALE